MTLPEGWTLRVLRVLFMPFETLVSSSSDMHAFSSSSMYRKSPCCSILDALMTSISEPAFVATPTIANALPLAGLASRR